MDENTIDCPCCVKLTGSLWLVLDCPHPADIESLHGLGRVYRSKEVALRARDPGEVVMELRLADSASGDGK